MTLHRAAAHSRACCPCFGVLLAMGLATALGGCGKSESPSTPAPTAVRQTTTASSSEPSATVPVSGHTVTLSDAADLAQVRNQQMIHPQFSLTPPDVDSPIILAAVQDDDKNTGAAVALKRINGSWKIAELAEAGHAEWVYAAAVSERKELWGILDGAATTRAATLTLVRSTDSGTSWQFFAAVKKPTADAEYAGFSMAKNGEGRLSMHIDDDDGGIAHGYYHYKTLDGGKSWTGPTFEGDDVTEADSLKDFDTLQEAIKSLEAPPGG